MGAEQAGEGTLQAQAHTASDDKGRGVPAVLVFIASDRERSRATMMCTGSCCCGAAETAKTWGRVGLKSSCSNSRRTRCAAACRSHMRTNLLQHVLVFVQHANDLGLGKALSSAANVPEKPHQ